MFQLFRKEVNDLYSGWSTWMVLVAFVIICGLFLWILPGYSYPSYGYASTELFFEFASYSLLFLIPAVTYGLFAQEVKNGTMEVLKSLPISAFEIVGSKYLASLTIVVFILLCGIPTLYSIHSLTTSPGPVEWGQLAGSSLGLLMLCGFFIAVGLFTSIVFESAPLSFISAIIIGFLFFEGWNLISQVSEFYTSGDLLLQKLSIRYHSGYFSRGVLTLSGIVYLTSLQLVFLFLCEWRLDKKEYQ